MKPITLKLSTTHRTLALKLIAGAFISGLILMLLISATSGTTHAQTPTPPAPTATVAPMTVGQPMMLQDAAGNTIMIMQGSTFYIFPKAIATPKP